MGDYSITAVDRRVDMDRPGPARMRLIFWFWRRPTSRSIRTAPSSPRALIEPVQVTLNTTNGTGSVTLNTAATGSNVTITRAQYRADHRLRDGGRSSCVVA